MNSADWSEMNLRRAKMLVPWSVFLLVKGKHLTPFSFSTCRPIPAITVANSQGAGIPPVPEFSHLLKRRRTIDCFAVPQKSTCRAFQRNKCQNATTNPTLTGGVLVLPITWKYACCGCAWQLILKYSYQLLTILSYNKLQHVYHKWLNTRHEFALIQTIVFFCFWNHRWYFQVVMPAGWSYKSVDGSEILHHLEYIKPCK